ncbi:MAG TPA: signal peptidase II, partial [Bacteroidota bacterium]
LGTSKPILGEFLKLTYIENSGMAFGLDFGGKMFFSVFSVVASVGILIYLFKIRSEPFPIRLSLAMILGGAVGNLIDRVFYGAIFDSMPLFQGRVVDFVDVDFFNVDIFGYHLSRWPVFNIADASVTVGVFLLLIYHRRYAAQREPAKTLSATSPAYSSGDPNPGSSASSENPTSGVKPDTGSMS